MGKGFIRQYYRGLLLSNRSVALISTNEMGEVNGFVTGVINPSAFYKEMIRKYWYRFLFASIPAALKKPAIVPRLIRAIRKPKMSCKGDNYAELTSICVKPLAENMGYGKELVKSFIDEACKRGCKQVVLYTDAEGNEKVCKFYSSLGFRLAREYLTPEARRMNEYRRSIP
jgi:ribosomal protein S18 acetylase RimI-like enzyme